MLTVLIIIINVLIGIIIYLWRLTREIKDVIKVNKDEHIILSKNDKRIVKDLQTFYTKQLKISEQILVLISLSKTIIQFIESLSKNEFYQERLKLNNELTKLKNLNSSLIAEIAKLKHELEQKDKELEEKREE